MNWIQKISQYYGYDEAQVEKLMKPTSEFDLPSPTQFAQMDLAVARIHRAMEEKQKIVIYGDYDCDGVMATSILVAAFGKLSYPVGYYLPSRYLDGYGLNVQKVEEMAEKGYQLIITVDNGINQIEAVEKAKSLGIDVIVTDHHELSGDMVDAYAILHPYYSHYGDVICCGAYVSYMLAIALLGHPDDYLLSLASIATISDMMELKGYNRDIVRLGLEYINTHHYRTIFSLTSAPQIEESEIASQIAPAVNAIGRMVENTSINRLVSYFVHIDDVEQVTKLAQWILSINEERRKYTRELMNIEINQEEPAILEVLDVKEGVLGIIANQWLMKENRCTLVLTKDSTQEGVYKGSIRSKDGLSVVSLLKEYPGELLHFGGHALAGGISFKEEELPKFRAYFMNYAQEHPFIKKEEKTISIDLSEITMENYRILRQFAPFGVGNPAPMFSLKHLATSGLSYSANGQHIFTSLSLTSRLVGFNHSREEMSQYSHFSCLGSMCISYFHRHAYLDFRMQEMEKEGIPASTTGA